MALNALPLREAITSVQDYARDTKQRKFVETLEFSLRVGIDPRQSNQGVRGSSSLPHGTGKTARVAVFADGDAAEAALAAGADRVGMEDLAASMQKGELNYDVVIAMPQAMGPVVGRLGPLLGPRNLMPNPKVGTVTQDVAAAVERAKAGQVTFRNDKAGIVHGIIGKVDFDTDKLCDNLVHIVKDIQRLKPASAKGTFLRKLHVSSTMGRSVQVELSSLGIL